MRGGGGRSMPNVFVTRLNCHAPCTENSADCADLLTFFLPNCNCKLANILATPNGLKCVIARSVCACASVREYECV